MVLLASRFARLKNVGLESSPSDPPLIIKSDPVSLKMAIFESIEILLNVFGPEGKITLSPRRIQNNCVLGIGYEHTILPEKNYLAQISSNKRLISLKETMVHLGGTARIFGFSPQILLNLPDSIDG
jgi:hypothetical protein